MSKRITAAILALILAVCAIACGQAGPETIHAEPSTTQLPPTEIPMTPPATEVPATETPEPTVRERYPIEENTAFKPDVYPYLVRTESAVWYLAGEDIELLGEEAFYDGLYAVLEHAEEDFADAREALKGYINEEVLPVGIHTDFCGHEAYSKLPTYGAFLNGSISLYQNWMRVSDALLHEYVHYLTMGCTVRSTGGDFWRESVAQYVANIVCRNRTADLFYSGMNPNAQDAETQAKQLGVWNEEENRVDHKKVEFMYAQSFANGDMVGFSYFTVGQKTVVRTQEFRDDPQRLDLMYCEASCLLAYLIETYGRDMVYGNWSTSLSEMEEAFGKPFSELYHDWAAWNTEQCALMGITLP